MFWYNRGKEWRNSASAHNAAQIEKKRKADPETGHVLEDAEQDGSQEAATEKREAAAAATTTTPASTTE